MAEAKPEKTLGSLLKKRMKADGGDHATATSAKGSAAEPSVIVAMTQPDPTLSMSQRLWNAAYDSLEGQDTELVQAYMRTLGKALGDNPDTCSVELADPSRRQAFMEKLVTEGKAKVAKTSKVTKGLDEFAKAILSAKPMVDLVIQNIPQAMPAAIPWAGVCAGLQILSNPAKANQSNLDGITRVVSRMDWYCSLSDHLLKGDASFDAVLQQLEKKVVDLYKALLRYQMESICSYYRHRGLVFLRALASLDDWDGLLKAVTDAEDELLSDWDQYDKLTSKSLSSELVNCGEETRSRLGDIHQTLQESVALQRKIGLEEKDEQCLQDLFVVDPEDDMGEIENKKDVLLEGAYQWILNTKEYAAFTNWGDGDPNQSSCQLLWIRGHAGTGKTMLLMGIIHELASQPAKLSPNVSYFFCQATDKDRSSAISTLRSLVWLLLVQQPHLIPHLRLKHKNTASSLFKGGAGFTTLSSVFKSMLKDPALSPIYFIVDALDECEEDLAKLTSLISASLTLSDKVKWLVSSRPSVELKTPNATVSLVELDDEKLDLPVNAYINYKLSTLESREGYDDRILVEVAHEIRQRTNHTFLWVALVFKELDAGADQLEPVHGIYALEIIKEMPSGLSELYKHMMSKIENQQRRDPQYCKEVLGAVVLAYRPVTLSELTVLADLPSGIAQSIVRKCGSFLTTKRETVYLIHQSAKDYLDQIYNSNIQPAGIGSGHAIIGRRSINNMMDLKRDSGLPILKQDIYDSGEFGFWPYPTIPPKPDPLAPIRYSCVFWAAHLCFDNGKSAESKQELADYGAVHTFFNERFLFWLESLSLLGSISDGLVSMSSLLQTVQASDTSHQLAGFLKDAVKFILGHRSIIDWAPLQVYGSALAFSPTMSEVRKAHWGQRLSFIKAVVGNEYHWSAHQQTLHGHSGAVEAVAFSPVNNMLASGSLDGTVRLWDATTGACQQTLELDGNVVCDVVFSPDGKTIATASVGHTVRLWDVATGTCRLGLTGHSSRFTAVAFSPDGKTVATASLGHKVWLWDAMTGKQRQILEHRHVQTIAFSPDSKIVASGSTDCTVRLWNAKTGTHQRTLEGHEKGVTDIAFSPDGTTMASAALDCIIRFWDAVNGAHLESMEVDGQPWTIAFSQDSNTIALGLYPAMVQLWDTTTKTYRQTLHGHGGRVNDVAFSADDKLLASASDDCTVRLWDVTTGADHKSGGQDDPVRVIGVSQDGTTIVSTSSGFPVRFWNTTTGTQRVLERSGRRLLSRPTFSPDGKKVALCESHSVLIWDVATGMLGPTLTGHDRIIWDITFSPDSKTVALAANDGTIRLWDPATGEHLHTLDHDGVSTVVFSRDGRMVAGASTNGDGRIWDAATGRHQQTIQASKTPTLRNDFAIGGVCDLHGNLSAVLNPASTHISAQHSAYGLSPDKQWVTRNSKNVLWLPPEYRPIIFKVAVAAPIIAMASMQHRFLILNFSE